MHHLTSALVTGANQGIGLGIAEVCLANNAACVFSLDISEPGEPFQELLKRFPGKLEYHHCDVTTEESVTTALNAIVEKKGRFDGMVANAGATKHQPALDFSLDQVKRLFELNVFGAWNCATAAAKVFIKLGCKGSIVFTASMTSYRPNRVSLSESLKEKRLPANSYRLRRRLLTALQRVLCET